jgi:arsenite methyltransferase
MTTTPTTRNGVDVDIHELRQKVQAIYQHVAEHPEDEFHFETGRILAERLGYAPADLDTLPPESVASFAGVGQHLELARLRPGERVLDLGSGSGMDAFLAAARVGPRGRVIGIDMTDRQLEKAESLRRVRGVEQLEFRKGFIEELPVEDGSIDVVISNGVINLSPDKETVFREVARVLAPRGRLAVSDIVAERQLTETIKCNTSLWAACIGGAEQWDRYQGAIERAGMKVREVYQNSTYRFLSRSAHNASAEFGVKSVSLLAVAQRGARGP